jgi:hypothetical protein
MDEMPDLPATLPGVTFLREVALEGQELFTELRYAGFTEKQATTIVAQTISDALYSRVDVDFAIIVSESDDDDDDFNLEDDEDDDRDGS